MFAQLLRRATGANQDVCYGVLDDQADLEDKVPLAPPKSRPQAKIVGLLSLGLVVTVVAVTLLGLFQYYAHPPVVDQCGYTPEEARKRGCTYELTSFSWLPDECLDLEVEEEFLQARDWHFYRDINGTDEVTLEEVRLGEAKGFFVAWDFHTAHCGYLLKKLHRALKRGGKVDSYIGSLEHTQHCVNFLLDPPPEVRTARQFTFRKYPFCGKEGGVGVEWPH